MTAQQLTRIVTCYRQWHLLRAWLPDARLHADGVRWIVVNDDPDDPCPDDLREALLSLEISIQSTIFNKGPSGARNLGATSASTEWIEFVDGDDVALPIDLVCLQDGRGFDLLAYPIWEVAGATGVGKRGERPENLPIISEWSALLPNLSPISVRNAGLVWNRERFLDLGGFDPRFDGAEDLEILLRAEGVGFQVRRYSLPKQAYVVPPRSAREAYRSVAHDRLWSRIHSKCSSGQRKHLRLIAGRDALHSGLADARRAFRSAPAICRFLWARLGL